MGLSGLQKKQGIACWSNGNVVPFFAVTMTRFPLPRAQPSFMKQFGRWPVTSTITMFA